jgi:hypothetical protein
MVNKTIILGLLSFAGFTYLTTYAHEYGHAAVCALYGLEWKIDVGWAFEARTMTCSAEPGSLQLYWAAGGIGGATASALAMAAAKWHRLALVGGIPHVVANLSIMGGETLAHAWYVSGGLGPFLLANIPVMSALIYLLSRYSGLPARPPGFLWQVA